MTARFTLNQRMEFDHVVWVHADGTVTDGIEGVYAPEVYWEDDTHHVDGKDWTLLTGYSGQHGYSGPVMHPSEFIGGRMEADILSSPGYYVAVAVDDLDGEPVGWVVATREAPKEVIPSYRWITYASINMAGNQSFDLDRAISLADARRLFAEFCDSVGTDDCSMALYPYDADAWQSAVDFDNIGCPFDYPSYLIERGPKGGVIITRA